DVPGTTIILIDFTPNRSASEVYMNANVDVTEFVKYMDKLKKTNPDLTYFHGMAFIMAKTLYTRPYLNRFVANRTLYMHKDVSLSFVAKSEFKDDAGEYLTVVKIGESDHLEDISKIIKEKVKRIRENKHEGGANDAADMVGNLPKPLRVVVVGFLKWLDKKGALPKSITDGNIYYSSSILSNLGTFKTGGIYHNLTNFGTSSSLVTFGEIKTEGKKKYMEMGITLDERIADGFYFCKAMKLIEYMFSNPEVLKQSAGEHVSMPK
ncbi:MAG: 2-oxo acid dehydrogenase subunit E2, partial [Bacilli bacterium]|nr:2-oxo acid dehydrogenase subunit E2 [Bacilli bacterium]